MSIKRTMDVKSPARLPKVTVNKEAPREAPQDPRLHTDNDTSSAKKVRPQAIGWRTRANVRVREISFSYPLMCRTLPRVWSKV
jgi:hypothetical protein